MIRYWIRGSFGWDRTWDVHLSKQCLCATRPKSQFFILLNNNKPIMHYEYIIIGFCMNGSGPGMAGIGIAAVSSRDPIGTVNPTGLPRMNRNNRNRNSE